MQQDKTDRSSNIPPPLDEKRTLEQIKSRDAIIPLSELSIPIDTLLSLVSTQQITIKEICNIALKDGHLKANKEGKYLINALIERESIGVHAYPPTPRVKEIPEPAPNVENYKRQIDFSGFLPDHLAFKPVPDELPPELFAKQRISKCLSGKLERDIHEPTTIFAPDNRYTFNDTRYPWSTCGKVETPGGSASGVMVGPRHVLTCSHAIQWNNNGTAGWIKFTPSYFDGSAPFGTAWGTWVYFRRRVDGSDGINRDEGQHDYVTVVLNNRIGDLTGWMGSRSWTDSWDNEPYWRHIGYPGDLASGQRPSYQRDIPLDGSFWDRERHTRIWHQGDVWPGQSGGPYFAWWSGENYPSAVAVQSGQNSDENSASGGSEMVDLIINARNDHP